MSSEQAGPSVVTIHGDALALCLRDRTIDAIVCDPPYGLEFMGKEWDGANGFRRALNPADVGRANVFGRSSASGPEYRSKARAGMAKLGSLVQGDGVLPSYLGGLNPKCRICDHWQRGANPCSCEAPDFPNERGERMEVFQLWCQAWAVEALRVAKPGAHLIAFGGTRTHHRLMAGLEDAGWEIRDMGVWLYRNGFPKSLDVSKALDKAAGAEREVLSSYRTNVGMQGGNFTAGSENGMVTRTAPSTPDAERWSGWGTALKPSIECWVLARKPLSERNVAANVLRWGTGALNIDGCRHPFASDEDKAEASDKNRHADFGTEPGGNQVYGDYSMVPRVCYDAAGRWPTNTVTLEPDAELRHFRFCVGAIADFAKAGSAERPWDAAAGRGPRQTSTGSPVEPGEFGGNPEATHPTVKPVDLMRHLVRLVTPPGGVVLDQFSGSGTTAQAALMEARSAVAIEQDKDYLPLIARRLSRPLAVSLFGGAAT